MKQAALGFRVHSGWTALVAVSTSKGFPVVLSRQRPHLVETFTYEFRQPYHTAEKKPLREAGNFIARMQDEARGLAYRAIHEIQTDLQKQGYKLDRCGLLLASGKPLPELSKILASHALIHTADGELFREAILHAAARCGLAATCIKERELLDRASQAFRCKPNDLMHRITELGRPLGSPWTQDEKFATLVAWLASAAPAERDRKARRESPAS